MQSTAARKLLHIQGWFVRVDEVVERGKEAYRSEDLPQEAGDSRVDRPSPSLEASPAHRWIGYR